MHAYLELLRSVLDHGEVRRDRTGVGTFSIFGYELRFDLHLGFPLLTTKKLHIKSIFCELLWFLRGDTNIKYLKEHGVSIWDAWADDTGELGPIYGKQWRAWETVAGEPVDQILNVIEQIKNNPYSRRHIVSAWNVGQLSSMKLPPCHLLFQFYVSGGKLSCKLTQRSADVFLGLPFNIASYALLTHLTAQQCGLRPGTLIVSIGDAHLYQNHVEQARLQLARSPRPLPTLRIKRCPNTITDYQYEDFEICDYNPCPAISAAVAV